MKIAELRRPAFPAPLHELARAEKVALLPPAERAQVLGPLSEQESVNLLYEWEFWARPDQLTPVGPWRIWLVRAGRGAGKTRTGAEWVRQKARTDAGSVGLFVAANPRDARDLMIDGPSGIRTISPPWERPHYEPSKLLLTWPNGTTAHVRSAAEPDGIRGPSAGWCWADELAKWKYVKLAWDNLRFAIREGRNAQTVVTTTPKPIPIVKRLVEGKIPGTVFAPRQSSYRNRANLDPGWFAEMRATYEGTRLGLQELHGEMLDEVEGALLRLADLDDDMHVGPDEVPAMSRIVIGVDPGGSSTDSGVEAGMGGECGIVVAGRGLDGLGYVLDDLSLRSGPATWASVVAGAYRSHSADLVVAEVNFGAETVRLVMRTEAPTVPFREVHASRGKVIRATPIVGLYQQRKMRHVGVHGLLEQQWLQWVPPGQDDSSPWSPDRLDAEVWAMTELMLDGGPISLHVPQGAVPVRPSEQGPMPGGFFR